MVLELARAYSDARLQESGELDAFCFGCSYIAGRDACSFQTRKQAFQHDQCDWSMTSGVGAMPRTGTTLAIYDPSQGRHVTHQRSDETAVREAISRNLRAIPLNS